jgi:hypothetical protein
MKDGFAFGVLLLVFLNPCAVAITVGLWLTILGWSWNSVLGEWPFFACIAQKLPRRVVPMVSLAGAVATLADRLLGLFAGANILLVPLALLSPSYKTEAALIDWWHTVPRVWLALAVEGPIVLLVYFGLSLILMVLKICPERRRRIVMWTVSALLVIGVATAFVGFGWPIVTAFLNPDSLYESLDVDHSLSPLLATFCPVDLVLAIGLSVWLVKSDDDQHIGVATSVVVVVLLTCAMVVSLIVGNYLVTLYARRGTW